MSVFIFKTTFYFPIVWFIPFSKQIFKLFSSHLFEQNANIEINMKCVLWMYSVCAAVCSGQRAKWYSWRQSPKGNELSGFYLRFWLEIEIFGFVWRVVIVIFVFAVVVAGFVSFRLYFLSFCLSTRESLFCCIEDIDDGKFTECECTVHNSKCLFKW